MIRAIAVDDEPLALDILKAYCAKADFIDLQKTFTSPTEAIRHLKRFPVDLIFLDIRMPSVTGIELLKSVPQEVMVIFTTAHAEFAVESYELNAIDYLLKPIEESRFMQAIGRAKDYFETQHLKGTDSEKEKSIFIRADYSLIKISLPEILYIEGLGDYLKIHLPEKKPVVVRMTMKSMLEKLPPKDFVRVHRSFIIPFSRIEHVRNKNVQVAGVQIPIGASFEEAFMERMAVR